MLNKSLGITPVDEANEQQRLAATPEISVFVSASAGSGKTKLLVDRLLRLMLPRLGKDGKIHPGTHPQRIQCLTYSKAAAAEMAIRLQRKLSEWVGYSDPELDEALQDLQISPDDTMRKAARALFAQVLDLPGGMRIETNHAFCQSILRRFPLEAEINPQFKVIEEGDNILIFKRAFDEKIDEASSSDVEFLSPAVSSQNFLEILQELQQFQRFLPPLFHLIDHQEFAPYLQKLLRLPCATKAEYLYMVCNEWRDEEQFRSCLNQAVSADSKTLKRLGETALTWLNYDTQQRCERWNDLVYCFLTQEKKLRSIKGTKTDNPEIADYLKSQGEYILEVLDHLNSYLVYDYTLALFRVFTPIWKRYQEIKRTQGALYYNDLIVSTLTLLDDPGAAWVLYKLDGGLDHILLDEVQDNSAEQWKIAADLSNEFFSGIGSDDHLPHPRTVFAVGDYKQSIYSFQGAKPQEFLFWHKDFRQKVLDAGQLWRDPQLRVSFRSSQVILDFVDQVFSPHQGLKGLTGNYDQSGNIELITHRSAKTDAPGRVDIWPLVQVDSADTEEEMELWQPLKENQTYLSAELILADSLAEWIKNQIGKIPSYGGAPIVAGDILILIRKRSNFSKALIRSLKSKNIPLANLVRTQLLDQLAVQDLLILCEILLLPQDDLALACVLKSPLGGLDDESLMQLAAPRREGQSLWGALYLRHKERPEWLKVWKMLSSLFLRIDYVTPYALLVEILGEHHGRAKLLARLGGEAVEAIDELLSQALQYENLHTPSLQGFLYWLKQSERMIKNEAETNLDMVRIMTVHGAKGLQGRLVILPDTMNVASPRGGFQVKNILAWKEDLQQGLMVPLYVPRKQFDLVENASYREDRKQTEEEESNRLLYVALTRASEWLLICGWQKPSNHDKSIDELPQGNWYKHSFYAIRQLNAQRQSFIGEWSGDHWWVEQGQPQVLQKEKVAEKENNINPVSFPQWMGRDKGWIARSLPSEDRSATAHLTPSRPDGVEFGELPSVVSPLQTKVEKDPLQRGKLVHQLLQYLPDCPHEKRYSIALRWLQQLQNNYSTAEIERLVQQVLRTMEHPDLQLLFDSKSLVEQPIVGQIHDVVITGQVDRMRILDNQIIFCDFKSGRRIPKSVEEVPITYLKQMAAYWALLRSLYPKHQIKPLIIWTDITKIMFLPEHLMIQYCPERKENLS
ncbi:double-strand break repair helicase AddA [Commensalibacter oyaizuii]|uniref:DNA 3'-5' helicase n=1 Tax=Commensalibacter oyaizuii TaxID=3043873 RepID=A0ABT6Q1T1_9PROT|nr:double-strand break repair helicase AddA [Commensalibacter sp. TBRC 16381]MDI2090970.1 double-strand break repair helicase AddA [Commensalibacter sp. TBRC 16381]